MDAAIEAAVELLGHSQSKKRVSGAKRLRKAADPAAGPALLEALQREVRDVRTWSAQYHMIAALGYCGHTPALPFLEELVAKEHDATILYYALGDAIFRLVLADSDVDGALEHVYAYGRPGAIYGAFRGLGMLRLTPSDEGIRKVFRVAANPAAIKATEGYPGDRTGNRLWAVIASTGWPEDLKRAFLDDCARIADHHLRSCVDDARAGKWRNRDPY